jgi:hypothetical protein
MTETHNDQNTLFIAFMLYKTPSQVLNILTFGFRICFGFRYSHFEIAAFLKTPETEEPFQFSPAEPADYFRFSMHRMKTGIL